MVVASGVGSRVMMDWAFARGENGGCKGSRWLGIQGVDVRCCCETRCELFVLPEALHVHIPQAAHHIGLDVIGKHGKGLYSLDW
jgi:hypothetical protein